MVIVLLAFGLLIIFNPKQRSGAVSLSAVLVL